MAFMKNFWKAAVTALAVLALMLPFHLYGQSTQGTILGTVRDASGAVVPNATVKVTDIDAGVTRTDTTDSSGNYQALNLNPGHYTVEVSANNFDTTIINGLTLVARCVLRGNAIDGHISLRWKTALHRESNARPIAGACI